MSLPPITNNTLILIVLSLCPSIRSLYGYNRFVWMAMNSCFFSPGAGEVGILFIAITPFEGPTR